MKINLVTTIYCLSLVHLINSKKYRIAIDDEILDYLIDKSVEHYSTYFNLANSWLEEIDEVHAIVGGYLESKTSLNLNLPIKASVRTQFFMNSRWNEGSFNMNLMDLCKEFIIPDRFWYNVTKLWTSDVCPPQKGDKWIITNQTVGEIFDIPPSVPLVPWRGFVLLTQGIPGRENTKTGFGIQVEFADL